jgi:hypothetical protein
LSSEVKAEKLFYLSMHLHQLRINLKAWSALEKLILCVVQFEDWRYDPDLILYDRDEIYWDEQPAPGGKKKPVDRDNVALDMDYFSRKMRRPKIETQEEVTQRMQAVELAVKEALAARGETRFTDQEFPPTEQSLYVDPDHPPARLQVCPQIIAG